MHVHSGLSGDSSIHQGRLSVTCNAGLPNPMYAPQQLSEDYILQLRYKTASPQDVPVTRLFPEYSAVGAEPGDSRAGDVEQYVFDGPGSRAHCIKSFISRSLQTPSIPS